MNSGSNNPVILTVTQMAKKVGMSRSTFYEHVGTRFPEPRYDIIPGRPVYSSDQQDLILQIMNNRVGLNGEPFVTYSTRRKTPKAPTYSVASYKRDTGSKLILSKYGLSKERYDKMMAQSEGTCYICGSNEAPLCVDHCHTTNRVRGLLCNNCNRGLGMFRDNVLFLKKAVMYLEKSAGIHDDWES